MQQIDIKTVESYTQKQKQNETKTEDKTKSIQKLKPTNLHFNFLFSFLTH